MKQQLKWSEETNEVDLITQFDDGTILSEPLTIKEASQWEAENKF